MGPIRILQLVSRAMVMARMREGLIVRPLLLVASPQRLAGRRFSTNVFGFEYTGDLGSWIDWYVYFLGSYERSLLALLEAALGEDRGEWCLDVGANVGYHTLFFSQFHEHIHAFEPVPEIAAELAARVATNRVGNVSLHQLALGSERGRREIHIPFGVNKGRPTLHGERVDGEVTTTLEIAVEPGDEYLTSIGSGRVDLVKIDTEGHERDVLAGLRDCIAKDRPVVVVEVSPADSAIERRSDIAGLLPAEYLIFAPRRRIFGWLIERAVPALEEVASGEMFGRETTLIAIPREKISRWFERTRMYWR